MEFFDFIAIKCYLVDRKMKCLHHQITNKEMSSCYLSSINVSLHIVTADIINDTIVNDLHFNEHGNIHQHVLKQ